MLCKVVTVYLYCILDLLYMFLEQIVQALNYVPIKLYNIVACMTVYLPPQSSDKDTVFTPFEFMAEKLFQRLKDTLDNKKDLIITLSSFFSV